MQFSGCCYVLSKNNANQLIICAVSPNVSLQMHEQCMVDGIEGGCCDFLAVRIRVRYGDKIRSIVGRCANETEWAGEW